MILNFVIWNIFMMLIRGADKTLNGSQEEDGLLQFHLQLYRHHCGDIVSCDSDTGHSEPPTDYSTAVSCCLPCPCIQSCTNKHVCCPDFGLHNDSDSYFEASREISTSHNLDQYSVTHSIEHTTTGVESQDLYRNRSVLDQQHGTQSKFDLDSRTDAIQSFTDATNLDEKNSRTTAHLLPHTDCIRPQVFNNPNFFIDSNAYMMVKFCFHGDVMVDKCYGGHVNTDISEIIPITSRLTGLTYLNRFCFMCNEGDIINETVADVWEAKIVHYRYDYYRRFVFQPNEMTNFMIAYAAGYHNIHFVPGTRNLVQPCEAYDIISCNQTGLWETYDENVEKLCHEGHSLPILHRISSDYNTLRFKNIACVYCNVGDSFNNFTELSCGYMSVDMAAHSYSQTLNLRVLDTDKGKDESQEKQHISFTERAILPIPNTDVCPSGYIALLGHCRRVICPRDQYVRNNQCVPLYRSVTGLDVNVKIEISLIDRVPKSIDSDVLFELRKIVNTSLAKYVTLRSRDLTVWYGPKQSKVRDKYYMFDIFLFNSSSTIDFGACVKEIRDFYNYLRTHDIIHVLNGDQIQIEINFNHRIVYKFKKYYDMSISGDGSLRVLEGRPMEDREDRPSMLVSNVNWCYRVPFDIANETDPIGKEDYSIKPAGITVYKHQYDIPQDTKLSLLYLCSDLFINRIDKDNSDKTADDLTILKPDIDDDNNIMALSIPANIAIIASCLGLCIVFALCKIHYTSIKPREQSGTQAIPVVGNASDVVISEDRTQHIEMVGQELGITDSIEFKETETN